MGLKDIIVRRHQQWINENLLTDLDQIPSRIRRWYVDNVFRRSLSYLVAFTDAKKAIILRCTGAGVLKVAPTGSGLNRYNTNTGAAADAYAAPQTHEFTEARSYLDILIESNDAVMSIKNDGGVWGDDIALPIGGHDYNFIAMGVKFKNRTAGNNAAYSCVSMR